MDVRGLDAYFTPEEAVEAFTNEYQLPKLIWEPSCGAGNISSYLENKGHQVYSSDIYDYGYNKQFAVKDFFNYNEAPEINGQKVDCIFTNPPFYCVNDYIRHAKKLCSEVIVFCKLQLLESIDRTDILEDGKFVKFYAFRNRVPTMHRLGYEGKKNSSAMAFAWYVFNNNHDGSPATFHRITCKYDPLKYKN